MNIDLYSQSINKYIMVLDSYKSIIDSYKLLTEKKIIIDYGLQLRINVTPISAIRIIVYGEELDNYCSYIGLINKLIKIIKYLKDKVQVIENKDDLAKFYFTYYVREYRYEDIIQGVWLYKTYKDDWVEKIKSRLDEIAVKLKKSDNE